MNCVAITAILIVLVIANYYVDRRRPERLEPYLGALILLLPENYSFPWNSLPLPAQTIGTLLSVAYAIPVFFGGIIFTESFRRHTGKAAAFGANIVDAVAGGLAQNASFGMKALLIIAAAFYALAGLFVVLGRRDAVRDLRVQAEAGARV